MVCFSFVEGRVLELLLLLNDHWQKHRLGSYKLVLLHNTAFNTCEFAKSQASKPAYKEATGVCTRASRPVLLCILRIIFIFLARTTRCRFLGSRPGISCTLFV